MERDVAIKVILDVALDVPEIKARFYREARTAGKLSHDNITIVHDVGEEDGRPYIVMEYLTGSDLRSLLDNHEPFPLTQKIEIAVQVCRGLAFSHSKDIIHRDIKPANIRVLDGRRVKIMDFGIAKPTSSHLTSTGAVIGTPYYMAPEQIQGKRVDKRCDIFSCGVLFYELLTLRKPFSGEEPTAVMYKIVHEQPEHLDEFERIVPARLRNVIIKMLQKDPEKRFPDLSDVAVELEAILVDLKSNEKKRGDDVRKKVDKLLAESRSLLNRQKWKSAYETAEKAAVLDPANSQILQVMQSIQEAQAEDDRRSQVKDRLQSARKLVSARQFVPAIGVLEEVLQLHPGDVEAAAMLETAREGATNKLAADARSSLQRNALDEAEQAAREILLINTQHASAKAILEAISARRQSREMLAEQSTQVADMTPLPPPPAPVPAPPPPKSVRIPQSPPPPASTVVVESAESRRPPASGRLRPAPQPPQKRPLALIIGIVAGVLVVAAVAYRLFLYTPAPPSGTVALNILPWAEVVKIEGQGGAAVPLQGRTLTPCRLVLPEGTYSIQLTNPAADKPLVLTVQVRKDDLQNITRKMPGYDYRKFVSSY
jgi:serine/threonine protein kinase